MKNSMKEAAELAKKRKAERNASPRPCFSDPAACWISGSDMVGFVYEPGPDPWIVQYSRDNWMAMTALIFARDAAHARQIVLDMLEHSRECRKKYVKYAESYSRWDNHAYLDDRLEEVRDWELKICPAPRCQMYKVGWGGNDQFGFCN